MVYIFQLKAGCQTGLRPARNTLIKRHRLVRIIEKIHPDNTNPKKSD